MFQGMRSPAGLTPRSLLELNVSAEIFPSKAI